MEELANKQEIRKCGILHQSKTDTLGKSTEFYKNSMRLARAVSASSPGSVSPDSQGRLWKPKETHLLANNEFHNQQKWPVAPWVRISRSN